MSDPLPTIPATMINVEGVDAGIWTLSDQGWWVRVGMDTPIKRELDYTDYKVISVPVGNRGLPWYMDLIETLTESNDHLRKSYIKSRENAIRETLKEVRNRLGPGPRGKEGYLDRIAKDLGVDP